MPIYTKTGDKGTTSIFGGRRVSKDSPIIEICGSIDELSSCVGLVIVYIKNKEDLAFLIEVQKTLYLIMAYFTGANVELKQLLKETKRFEQKIDIYTSRLPKLNRFVLYSGSKTSSLFNVLRVQTRKSERRIITYLSGKKNPNSLIEKSILVYINRLSDLFFIFARKCSKNKEILT
ncbi:MAG: cob(I)yrinic acid a,c-diamide adenosyltransferase [bacterium]